MTLAPNPQFSRAGWHDLCGTWAFAHDDADVGLDQGWMCPGHDLGGEIIVPFPPESRLSGVGDTGFHRVMWYSLRTRIAVAQGKRAILHFGAVDYEASVWVNGQHVVDHEGGMTPFSVDITAQLTADAEQLVTVRVMDDPHDASQPRGKQDWRREPHGIFYERTSGIWQPVWWEEVSPEHLTDLVWHTDLTRHGATVEVGTSGLLSGAEVRVTLSHEGTVVATTTFSANDRPGAPLVGFLHLPELAHGMDRRRLLWSPDSPTLLDATLELVRGSELLDRVDSYLGVRSCGFRDGHFLLNEQPYYLRLVLEQGYWPDSHLAAPDEAARRHEVELIKDLGFNGARVHQKVEDPRFLYWCDKLGLLVWGEMANGFTTGESAQQRLVTEWMQVVKRDRSHPSLVAWVPLNESWGVQDIQSSTAQQHFASAMYHLTKALDPSRPAVSNDGWEHTESDLWTVHDYTPYGDSIRERYGDAEAVQQTLTTRGPGRRRVLLGDAAGPGRPLMITEFGGLSYAPSAGQNWFGYSTFTSEADFLERLDDLVTAITDMATVAGFCYTQLTDTLQEANGLLRADRSPKLPVAQVREIITRPAASLPSEMVDQYRREAARVDDSLSPERAVSRESVEDT